MTTIDTLRDAHIVVVSVAVGALMVGVVALVLVVAGMPTWTAVAFAVADVVVAAGIFWMHARRKYAPETGGESV